MAGPVIPFILITIACGALSGFHATIGTGTTPKMIGNEKDVLFVGYGAMLTLKNGPREGRFLLDRVSAIASYFFRYFLAIAAFASLRLVLRFLITSDEVFSNPDGSCTPFE